MESKVKCLGLKEYRSVVKSRVYIHKQQNKCTTFCVVAKLVIVALC